MPRKATEKTVPEVAIPTAQKNPTDELKEAAIAAGLKMCEDITTGREREPYKALEVVTSLINAIK